LPVGKKIGENIRSAKKKSVKHLVTYPKFSQFCRLFFTDKVQVFCIKQLGCLVVAQV